MGKPVLASLSEESDDMAMDKVDEDEESSSSSDEEQDQDQDESESDESPSESEDFSSEDDFGDTKKGRDSNSAAPKKRKAGDSPNGQIKRAKVSPSTLKDKTNISKQNGTLTDAVVGKHISSTESLDDA